MSTSLGTKDAEHQEDFAVSDAAGSPVTGLVQASFTTELYEENDSLSALPVTITELGGGGYRAKFTPDASGSWYLTVKHATHFPDGQAAQVQVFDGNLSGIYAAAEKSRKIETNRVVISADGLTITVYEDDNTTIAFQLSLSADRCTRTPIP